MPSSVASPTWRTNLASMGPLLLRTICLNGVCPEVERNAGWRSHGHRSSVRLRTAARFRHRANLLSAGQHQLLAARDALVASHCVPAQGLRGPDPIGGSDWSLSG
jgi:hypothetical protein